MRSLGMLILAVSLGLFGLLVWQISGLSPGRTQPYTYGARLPVKPAADKTTRAVHGSAGKKVFFHGAPDEISLPPDLSASIASIKTVMPPRLVPDPGKMDMGATGVELQKRYGPPSFTVSSMLDGVLVERYYYLKPDRANVVVATLREGKLVSTETARLWQPQRNLAARSAE